MYAVGWTLILKLTCKLNRLMVVSRSLLTFDVHDSPVYSDISVHPEFSRLPFNFIDIKMGLIVGMNCPELIKPTNIVNSSEYAWFGL